MTEAPERIWVTMKGHKGGEAWAAQHEFTGSTPYVLASVADEDRRKLGVAVDELKRAHEFFVAFKYPSAAKTTRAAIAEIEGEEG